MVSVFPQFLTQKPCWCYRSVNKDATVRRLRLSQRYSWGLRRGMSRRRVDWLFKTIGLPFSAESSSLRRSRIGRQIIRNVGKCWPNGTVSYSRRPQSSRSSHFTRRSDGLCFLVKCCDVNWEVKTTSETSGSAGPTAQFHIPEDLNRQGLRILRAGPIALCFVVNCCDVNWEVKTRTKIQS